MEGLFKLFSLLVVASVISANNEEDVVSKGNNEFGNNLFKALSEGEIELKNLVMSPISAHSVLSMANQGSGGSTLIALNNALKVPTPEIAAEGYKTKLTEIEEMAQKNVIIANKIFLQRGSELKDTFKTAVSEKFHSDVGLVNFEDAESSAKTVNEWVESNTNDKIKDIVTVDDFKQPIALVLINAIYFRAKWENEFDKTKTVAKSFYLTETEKVDVPTMHQQGFFPYKDNTDLDAQVLEMEYNSAYLSMLILLPNQKTGLKNVEEKIANIDLAELIPTKSTRINVALPKFKIESTIDLKDPLTKLGLGELFTSSSNFSGMIKDSQQLSVGKILQKAFIDVDEEGTEAAASTILGIYTMSLPVIPQIPPIDFVVDHPFLFFVFDTTIKKNPTVLFQGRVTNI